MDFGDVLWSLLIIFFMISYFMLLFSVIVDLFRNPDSSGIAKALWIVLLIFLPLLTMLVYVIVNGKGMTARNLALQKQARDQQDDYIRSVAGAPGVADQIARGQELLAAGTIDQAEFDALKAKALA